MQCERSQLPPGLADRSSGFDIHSSSNGIPRLGGTVDFETLVAGPAMAVTSSSGLGVGEKKGQTGDRTRDNPITCVGEKKGHT